MSDRDLIAKAVAVMFVAVLSIGMGLRMLFRPERISKKSLMYRYMLNRYFIWYSEEAARAQRLAPRQIRLYGMWLAIFGVMALAVVYVAWRVLPP